MYKVYHNNALMYSPDIEELALINPVVELEENKAGSFSFKILPDHPFYDSIKRRKSVIDVYQDDDLIFSGICIEEKTDFYKQKTVSCEGELTYLNDSIQRPKRYQNISVRGLLEAYIASHNSQVDESKQFTVGIVTVIDNNDSLYRYTNMNNTLTEIKEDLVDDLGGYISVRHENNIRYLDYLADSMNVNTQEIRMGENLMDFTSNIDSTDIATAVIPLGCTIEESTVEGLETRLTIESVNDGLDYVYNEEAVNNYGWIYKPVIWDDVTTASALKRKGEQYLSDIQFENMVIEAKAIDLHLTDSEFERFKISDQIRVVSEPHGLNRLFRLTRLKLYLNNSENNTVTLGKSEKLTLSAKTNQENESIKKALEKLPPRLLTQAKENATALITSAMGGYVYKTNSELYIMDTDDPKTAKRVWRWNINGLGYSSTGIDGEYGLAMTMDGAIVADLITTGTMFADRIKGGTLTLGASENENGKIYILDSDGNLCMIVDKDGIDCSGNSFKLSSTNLTINKDGSMVCNNIQCNNITAFSVSGNAIQQFSNSIDNSEAMSLAKQAINKAQSAADTASSAASQAQIAANTANSAASQAQRTADTANATANNLNDTIIPQINSWINGIWAAMDAHGWTYSK